MYESVPIRSADPRVPIVQTNEEVWITLKVTDQKMLL